MNPSSSLGRFLLGLGLSVGESDIKLLGSLDDSESFVDGDVLGDLSTVGSIVHKKEFDVLFAGDEHLLESSGEGVSGLLILLVSDLGHLLVSSESPSGEAIDTSDHSVRSAKSLESIRLESVGVFGNLLNDLSLVQWGNGHFYYYLVLIKNE